ncbi:MAG TPA: hypothetical protein VD905_08820 [Flavobacteriales bacterium]|nr:hypothetical protein [Flavobacteriales bacterium]
MMKVLYTFLSCIILISCNREFDVKNNGGTVIELEADAADFILRTIGDSARNAVL